MALTTEAIVLSENEACRLLRKRREAIKALVADGALKTVTLNGRTVITRASLDAYLGIVPAKALPTQELDPRSLAAMFRQFATWLEKGAA